MALSGAGIYEVVEAMVPLYIALTLGYGSIRWWGKISPEGCDTINSLVANFIFPFFAFRFTLNTNPYKWNYGAIAGDVIAKVIIMVCLAAWVKCSKNGSFAWAITSFSLITLTNALVMGEPLLRAMYGDWAGDLVVQLAVFQAVTWLTLDLFVLELRKALEEMKEETEETEETVETNSCQENAGEEEGRSETDDVSSSPQVVATNDLESGSKTQAITRRLSVWSLMKVVGGKLARNPNSYSCLIGFTLALITNRDDFKLQNEIMSGFVAIMAECVNKMANCGPGMAMFGMGAFMATQRKFIACGPKLTLLGMALRFLAGPVAMAIGCYAAGLRGDVLRVAIIQVSLSIRKWVLFSCADITIMLASVKPCGSELPCTILLNLLATMCGCVSFVEIKQHRKPMPLIPFQIFKSYQRDSYSQ